MFLKMFSEEIKKSSQWTPTSLQEWTITESPNLLIDSLILRCLSARVTSFSCIYSFLPSCTESLPESVPYCLDFKLIKLWGTTTFLFYVSSCLRYIIKWKKTGLIVKETKVPNSTVQWKKILPIMSCCQLGSHGETQYKIKMRRRNLYCL